jgi:glycosyltransferase involved in cell wall biosynthesis
MRGAAQEGAILQIHWCFPPTTGGVESHLADLASGLSALGYRVIVLTGEQNPIRPRTYEVITSDLLNLERIKSGRIAEDDLKSLILDIVNRHRIAIIHGHNLHHFHPAAAAAIEWIRRTTETRVYHTIHETWPGILETSRVYRLWNRNFVGSRHIQRECETLLGLSTTLHPLCVNTDLFRPSSVPFQHSPAIILHPSRMLPWKGVHIGVDAVSILIQQERQVTLLLTDTQQIADWNEELASYRSYIADLVSTRGLNQHVQFVSASYSEMPELYNRADVVIYPTVGEEPFGLAPLEAMSCMRPVVVSRSGAMPEVVDDGITGYVVSKGDPVALSCRIAELLDRPSQAVKMGEAARSHVLERFNFQKYISMLVGEFFA